MTFFRDDATGIVMCGDEEIPYTVVHSKRRTLGIHVYSDARVVVRAPFFTRRSTIKKRIDGKADWIQKKIHDLKALPPREPALQYTEGEQHLYLGSAYPLRIMKGKHSAVVLTPQAIEITVRGEVKAIRIKKILDSWYRVQAVNVFGERIARCVPRVPGVKAKHITRVSIRAMKTRWGSLSRKGSLNLNLALIRAELACIDYVVIHELCHFKRYAHDKKYYALLENILPDWKRYKKKLNGMRLLSS